MSQFGTFGAGDGQLSNPKGIAIDELGTAFVVDQGNSRVQQFDSSGTYVDKITRYGYYDPGDSSHLFASPTGIAIDSAGILYMSDTNNNRILVLRNLLAPRAFADSYVATYETPLNVVAPGILSNDNDFFNDTLTPTLISNVSNGTLNLSPDGSFTYTPNTGFLGVDNFTYLVNDGTSDSNTVTVTLTVGGPPPVQPGQLELKSPLGVVPDTIGNPTYEWTEVENAISYEVYLAPKNNIYSYRFYDTVTAAQYCADNICRVDLTTITPTAWLNNDTYEVYLKANNSDWNGPFEFTVSAPTPEVVNILSVTATTNTLRPTISWNLPGTAANTAWYQMYIAPVDDLFNPAYYEWNSRQQVCGSWSGTSCSFMLPLDLMDNTYYAAYIQSWGPQGFSVGGIDNIGWAFVEFNVGGPLPAPPTGIQVSASGGQATVTWNDDPIATSFNVWIGDINNLVNNPPYFQIHNKSEGICNGATCTLTPSKTFANGSYLVYLQAIGPNGHARGGIVNLGWAGGQSFSAP